MANMKMTEHLTAARMENALFLMGHGLTLTQACERLGVSYETLSKDFERKGFSVERHSSSVTRTRQGA